MHLIGHQCCQIKPDAVAWGLTVVMGLWSGYRCQVIEDFKSCYPEVKASKSDKRLRSYSHLKICHQKNQKFSGVGPPDPPPPLTVMSPADLVATAYGEWIWQHCGQACTDCKYGRDLDSKLMWKLPMDNYCPGVHGPYPVPESKVLVGGIGTRTLPTSQNCVMAPCVGWAFWIKQDYQKGSHHAVLSKRHAHW